MPNQIFRSNSSTSHPPQRKYSHLTPEQVAFWMQYGFIHLKSCFSRTIAARQTQDLFFRLGPSYNPHDQSTWKEAVHYLPSRDQKALRPSEFAPKAWAAICDLCGGEERLDRERCDWWGDGFIVNLGSEEDEGRESNVVDAVNGWHVDGDFFVHFLDSPEQALLVVPCWGDVIEGAGGTVVCVDGIGEIAKRLHDHPEGLSEELLPLSSFPGQGERWICGEIADRANTFFELTGEAGDVFILHPLMIHSAAKNGLRIPRIITNPGVSLKQPFNFDRKDRSQYSLVELKTLQELGRDRLPGWKITGNRGPLQSKWKAQRRREQTRREEEKKKREQEEEESKKLAQLLHEAEMLSREPPPVPARFLPHREGSGEGQIRLQQD